LQKACLLKDFAATVPAESLISHSRPPRCSPDRSLLSFSTACVLLDCEGQVLSCDFAYSADKSQQGDLQKAGLLKDYVATPRPFHKSLTRLYRSILSLADDLPAVPLPASLVSFCCRRLACRAARCISRFFLSPTSCPLRRPLHRTFLSIADDLPAVPIAASLVSFSSRPAALFAASLVSFSCRRHARRIPR
jgi:hypothetical protein